MAIPALLSKKLNGRPVMMRISREEETYIGRTRPGFQAWAKMGFKKDGRVTAIDAFIVEDSGPVSRARATTRRRPTSRRCSIRRRTRASAASRWPPTRRRGVSQRAPGGLQSAVLFEPMVDKAAKQLGVDQVEIRKINAPVNGSQFGLNPAAQAGTAAHARSRAPIVKEALDRGRRAVQLGRAQEAQRPAQRHAR